MTFLDPLDARGLGEVRVEPGFEGATLVLGERIAGERDEERVPESRRTRRRMSSARRRDVVRETPRYLGRRVV
jgi:hypothetical protein